MHQILSEREIEVAFYLAWGFTDKEVARQLSISFETARTHHSNIYQKTKCRNNADLTRWYFEAQMQISFGKKPSLKHILSVCVLLLLIGICEMMQSEMLRVRTSTSVRAGSSYCRAKRTKSKNTFLL